MPATFTVSSGSERVVVEYPERSRASRTSSGGSVSIHSPDSSGGSRSYSGSAGSADSWSEVEHPYEDEDDGIEPSDSASRSRQPSPRRQETEVRPAPVRRHSSHRLPEREESPQRRPPRRKEHRSSRRRRTDSRRVPSDESNSTVASYDDYPHYGHHGVPPPAGYPPQPGYSRPPPRAPVAPSLGGYPPSVTSAATYGEPYGAHSALVHLPQIDPFAAHPAPNPNAFGPASAATNPFTPISPSEGMGYFPPQSHAPSMAGHHRPPPPPRPQSYAAPPSHYGSEVMSPYGMPPYSGYGMHPGMPGYPPMHPWGYPPPPSTHASPPPPTANDEKKDNNNSKEIESLKALIQKHEEAAVLREQEQLKRIEAEAAAAAAAKAKDEEEKKKKQEIADASKKAKEDAEKKAEAAAKKLQDEHDKKWKEAEAAKAELEKKHKEVEEERDKLKPAPDTGKPPIRFKDAVGRKFSFPFHLCKTWKGMESLIKQAFLHVEIIGEHVHQGHYDLMGPDGEILLPQVWETMIQPDTEISMHMWPMPEAEDKKKKEDKLAQDAAALADPFAALGLGDLGIVDPNKKPKKKGSKKDKKGDPNVVNVGPAPGPGMIPPPPPGIPGGILPDPLGMAGMFPPGISPVDDKKGKPKRSSSQKPKKQGDLPPLAAWFAGSGGKKPKK